MVGWIRRKRNDAERMNVISIPGKVQAFSELFLQLSSKLDTVLKRNTTEARSLEYVLNSSLAYT